MTYRLKNGIIRLSNKKEIVIMLCCKCIVPMKHVLRFMNGKSFELYRCPRCSYESKATPYSFNKEISQKRMRATTGGKKKKKNVQRIYNYNKRNSQT